MSSFQALTNNVLEAELEMLRERLGLDRSQKAELLREVSALAAWVIRQAERGRESRRGTASTWSRWSTLCSSASVPGLAGALASRSP